MSVSKPVARECFVINSLAAGEQVVGKKGYVNCQLLGCCNSNRPTFYVPCTILSIAVHGCDEMRVVVKLNIDLLAADNQVMDVAPNGFFPSKESVKDFVEAQRVYNEYKKALRPFENYNSDLRVIKTAFGELLQKTTKVIKEDVEDYAKQNEKSLSRLDKSELKRFGSIMVKALYYPELSEDEEPEDIEEDL